MSDLPPNQVLAAPGKWPVVGERTPGAGAEDWTVEFAGLCRSQRSLTLAEIRSLPQVEQVVDVHCVTRWSKPRMRFRGVPLSLLLDLVHPEPEARFLSFIARSDRAHSTSLPLADALQLNVLVAFDADGEPLPPEHGGPIRTITPHRYFYKSLKWLRRIEFLAEDRLGYWEAEAGYHNHADPLLEERYVVGGISPAEARALLANRNVDGRDLLSLEAASLDLRGLSARGAKLRNALFESSDLRDADLSECNLSNARLAGADLRGASLRGADVEGADFSGADLRGADLSEASLFGTTFVPEPPAGEDATTTWPFGAQLDTGTRIDPDALERLSPNQQLYVGQKLWR